MRDVLQRLGGYVPAAIALALPTLFIPTIGSFPSVVDSFILPRASLVIAGACLAIGVALLTPGRTALGALRWPLAAAAAAAVLAFLFSVSWPLSFMGSYTRYESLPIRLSYLGLLAGTTWVISTRTAREAVVPAYVFGTAVASLEAVGQAISNVPFRPDGNLGNANLLAALIAMALPLAVARGLRMGSFVVAWWLAVPVLGLGLWASTSRSGVLGALAGCLALAAFLVSRRFPQRRRLVAGVMAAALAMVGLLIALITLSPLSRLNDDPPSLRLHLWSDGVRLFLARPLTGWGEDTTGLTFGRFLSHSYAGLVTFDRIHSGPLDLAVTQGLFGLAALAWVMVVVFNEARRTGFRDDVAGLAAALVAYTVWVLFNFDWAPASGAFWVLAGTLWSWIRAGQADAASDLELSPARAGPAWTRSVGALSFVAIAVALAALPLLADAWYYEGRPDLSVRVDPLQSRYHWALGDRLVARGDPQGGVHELERAADLGETAPDLYVDLGDVDAGLGRIADAGAAYRRALAIDPYYTPASRRLAALKG